jgi:transcriptional regulator with XRE-family HTH domain
MLVQLTLKCNRNESGCAMSVLTADRLFRPAQGQPQIGSRIREARQALGLTQEALAHNVGVSRSAVAQWETERTGQVRANLTRVAAVLGVSLGFLLNGDSGPWADNAETADEWALLRLYRQLRETDRQEMLRLARRLVAAGDGPHR